MSAFFRSFASCDCKLFLCYTLNTGRSTKGEAFHRQKNACCRVLRSVIWLATFPEEAILIFTWLFYIIFRFIWSGRKTFSILIVFFLNSHRLNRKTTIALFKEFFFNEHRNADIFFEENDGTSISMCTKRGKIIKLNIIQLGKAALTEFYCRKMYIRFTETKKVAVINEVTTRRCSTVY